MESHCLNEYIFFFPGPKRKSLKLSKPKWDVKIEEKVAQDSLDSIKTDMNSSTKTSNCVEEISDDANKKTFVSLCYMEPDKLVLLSNGE